MGKNKKGNRKIGGKEMIFSIGLIITVLFSASFGYVLGGSDEDLTEKERYSIRITAFMTLLGIILLVSQA